jgi:hypothetical protein
MIDIPNILKEFETASGSVNVWDVAYYEFVRGLLPFYSHLQEVRENPAISEKEKIRIELFFLRQVEQGGDFVFRRCAGDELKRILSLDSVQQAGGWVTISEFGREAEKNALFIALHDDWDPDFQKEVLEKLAVLYPLGEADPRGYANMVDRVAVSHSDPGKRTLQRYGTQLYDFDGNTRIPLRPYPIEDQEHVNERRRDMGLDPIPDSLLMLARYPAPKI